MRLFLLANFIPAVFFLSALTAAGALTPRDCDSIGYPFCLRSDPPHEVRVINDGTAALELRLELIEQARQSIDLEYYIFAPDRAGQIMAQTLLRRAQDRERPVHIRMLLDHYPLA